jgi:hypothetical protein
MKTLILSCLAALALLTFPACTTVEDHSPSHSTTTTTEETTTRQPVSSATTETRVIRRE